MPSLHLTRPATQPTFNPYELHAIRIPLGLVEYSGISWGAKVLYGRLALFRGRKQDGYCHPSLQTLATEMRSSVDSIERWLRELTTHGFIKRQRRQRQAAECLFPAHPCLLDSATLPNQEPLDSATLRFRVGNSAVLDSANLRSPNKEENVHRKRSLKTCASDDAQMCVPDQLFPNAPHGELPVNRRAASESPRRVTPIGCMTDQQKRWFDQWWNSFWLHKAKKAAREAFRQHVQTEARFQQVLTATKAQASAMMAREPQHRLHGSTWLHGERWEDEPDQPAKLPPRAAQPVYYPPLKTIFEREREK